MQKFSDFINEHKSGLLKKEKEMTAQKFNDLYEAKLKGFGASTPLDLNEEQSKEFFSYLQSLREGNLNEAEIKDEKAFREFAEAVLRKAHPKDYDEKIANKTIDDLVKGTKNGDWGATVGRLTSGLGK
jgi:hypothetical protein